MSQEKDVLEQLELSSAEKQELRRRLNSSVASFAAYATSLLQGRDSATTTAQQLRGLIAEVIAPEGAWKQRDLARVGEIASSYRHHPEKLAITCPDPDTRLWLARALQVALDVDRHPHHGVYAVRANPTPSEAGEIIVVAPEDPQVKGYPRVLVF